MLGELKEKTQSTIIKEFAADGAMIQYNSMGEFKGQKYHATHMETVDVKVKNDGTNEWETRAIEMTKEGDVVMITGKGTGRQDKGMEGTFSGEIMYMTNSPRLSWLNNTKGWVEGMTKGDEATIKVYTEKTATAQVAAPMM